MVTQVYDSRILPILTASFENNSSLYVYIIDMHLLAHARINIHVSKL